MERSSKRPQRRVVVPCPDRVRAIHGRAFGWLEARLQREGWLALLGLDAVAVYALLCLAADRQGVSYYRRDSLARTFGVDFTQIDAALERLVDLNLVGFEPFHRDAVDGFHQVLSLPAGPPRRRRRT